MRTLRGGTTGVGSLPGTDPTEAMRIAFGESLDIPFMAELPARGPGADMVGRTCGVLVDLYVDRTVSGWRIVPRAGIDWRRTRDLLARDLDALEIAADGYDGQLKIQVAGPWTLTANVELASGHRIQTDRGALRDVHESLAEGTKSLVEQVAARCSRAQVIVQLDEPSLPAVLGGRLPTASGFDRLSPVDEPTVEQALHSVIDMIGVPVLVHSCAKDTPLALLQRAGAKGAAIDLSFLTQDRYEEVGEVLDADFVLYGGAFGSSPASAKDVDQAARQVRRLARDIGLSASSLHEQLGLSPSCGLAGFSTDQAIGQLRAVIALATQLRNNPEEEDDR